MTIGEWLAVITWLVSTVIVLVSWLIKHILSVERRLYRLEIKAGLRNSEPD